LECVPLAQGNRSLAGGVIDTHPSGGRGLLCSLNDYKRARFYGLAIGVITIEEEHFICVLWLVKRSMI